ncbi:MAG: AF1514 family protein [Gemmatimonadota bacterium]|nr:MAG: AF1514 family protein [Gemmatimonadota bacterium]
MKTIAVTSQDLRLDFNTAKAISDGTAKAVLGEATCMSWYDREQDREAPAHVSECRDDSCDTPGYIDYATSRGAELKIDIGEGAFVFCYRSLGDFSEQA